MKCKFDLRGIPVGCNSAYFLSVSKRDAGHNIIGPILGNLHVHLVSIYKRQNIFEFIFQKKICVHSLLPRYT